MNIIFENSYTRNKELAKEIYQFFYFKRSIYIIFDVILGLSFLANIVSLLFGYKFYLYPVICATLFYALQFYQYFTSVNVMMNRDNEINQGEPIHVSTIVTEEYLENTASTGSINQLNFTQVKKVFQTKNLILLRSHANLIYIFNKDTFTKGSYIELIEFLIKKGFKP